MNDPGLDRACDGCQFILHCGCYEDDHEYKLEACQYYAVYEENKELRARLEESHGD